MSDTRLKRSIGLPLITLYGLGTILGAGIYVLVGKVAGSAGLLAPLSFLMAALVAGATALSYAQLVVLFPKTAAEAVYVQQGFQIKKLSALIGWMLVVTAMVSSATLTKGFLGYLSVFIELPNMVGVPLVVIILGFFALWGISESLWLSALMTLLEIGGLLLVVILQREHFAAPPLPLSDYFVPISWADMTGIFAGAFLAFYAFIGFEDMVNVAEEVKEPSKTMPRAIALAVIISTALYMLISWVAVMAMPLDKLTASDAPLADLVADKSAMGSNLLVIISLFAIVNGVLIQMIMGSRVLYGMGARKFAPPKLAGFLTVISERTQTPINATLIIITAIITAALALPLVVLAKITSFVILMVFMLVNLSLWKVKKQPEFQDRMTLVSFPLTAAVLCFLLLVLQTLNL
ncbi:MAG: amino acid permease [Cellvibrionaceae bacterium]